MKKIWMSLLIVLLAITMAACAGGEENNANQNSNENGQQTGTNTENQSSNEKPDEQTPAPEPEPNYDPVTLQMYQTQRYWTQEDFDILIAEPVKAKYPHITVELVSGTNIAEALIQGADIDLVAVWNGLIPEYEDMAIFEDVSPLVKKHNMDLTRFDQGALDAVKMAGKTGELYGFPNLVQFNAMYYNKDIFDQFGVDYPRDGMTWEEAIAVGEKVTRTVDGFQYFGLDPDYLTRLLTPMSLGIVDGRDDSTDVNSETYKMVFELGKKIYDIPGNMPPFRVMSGNLMDRFGKDQNTAMITTINRLDQLKNIEGLNWDIAQYPSYKERPNMYGAYDMHIMTISSISKHKDDAFRVLEVLFSDEVMLLSSQMGKVTAMSDPKFNEAFLQGVPEFQDKNIEGIFKSKPAPATPPYSVYYSKSRGMLVNKFRDYVEGKFDVNTALREAEAEIKQYILSEKGS